jgi:hypothetical protein
MHGIVTNDEQTGLQLGSDQNASRDPPPGKVLNIQAQQADE